MPEHHQSDSAGGRAFTIAEFCARNGGISRSTFYNLRLSGRGPKLMRISANRVAISPEAEAEWRRRLEGEHEALAGGSCGGRSC